MTYSLSTPDAPRPTTTLVARQPEDMLALAPVLMGFWPEESVVMLTFGADRPFHARTDLPPPDDRSLATRRQLEELLLGPARRLRAQAVALVYFSTDRAAALATHRVLRQGCRRSGITVVAALAADGERYVDLEGGSARSPGTPYDVSAHPFVVEAIVSGRLSNASRSDLVASLEADPAAVDRVSAALVASGLLDGGLPIDGRSIRREGRWVEETVSDLVGAGTDPTDEQAARLLWVMQVPRVRDAAWSLIRQRDAEAHVRFWSALVQRAPEPLVAAPAGLLGWSSWQAGDGARAWVAVDRCLRADPEHTLATHLGSLLQNAVPPNFWEGGFDWALGLPAPGPDRGADKGGDNG